MNRHALLLAAWALGATPAARAAQAGFDCARAQGEVESLICRDPALAALDRQLADVFRAALAKARGPAASRLRTEQRGWLKGRNECWKSNGQETWITASWTVRTVPACVDAQVRLRISELQAVWRLLPPRTVSYMCRDNPANEFVAHHFETSPKTMRLERGDRTATLWQVGAAGAYEGQNVSLSVQAGGAVIRWLDVRSGKTEDWTCRLR